MLVLGVDVGACFDQQPRQPRRGWRGWRAAARCALATRAATSGAPPAIRAHEPVWDSFRAMRGLASSIVYRSSAACTVSARETMQTDDQQRRPFRCISEKHKQNQPHNKKGPRRPLRSFTKVCTGLRGRSFLVCRPRLRGGRGPRRPWLRVAIDELDHRHRRRCRHGGSRPSGRGYSRPARAL